MSTGRRLLSLAAILIASLSLDSASAQPAIEVVFTSPPSPVGAGARATGIGSAFIAVADDATAASWNPGGLTNLERAEISVVSRSEYTIDEFGVGAKTESSAGIDQVITADGSREAYATTSLDYLSLAIPFSFFSRTAVASINYQQMLSFKSDLHFQRQNSSAVVVTDDIVHVGQTGSIDALTGALAVEPAPGLSFGIALNFWLDGLGRSYAWRQEYDQNTTITFPFPDTPPFEVAARQQFTYDHFRGWNATLGALWKPTNSLSLGAVTKLPFNAHANRTIRYLDPVADDFRDRIRLRMPLSIGAGAAYRPTDDFTISADLTYVYWDQFRVAGSDGNEFLLNGDPERDLSVDGALTERVGAEYLWHLDGLTVAGRTGLFFDPEPSRGDPRPLFGGSLGVGLTWERLSLDLAYQARAGFDVRHTLVATEIINLSTVPDDRLQNLFYASLIHYF